MPCSSPSNGYHNGWLSRCNSTPSSPPPYTVRSRNHGSRRVRKGLEVHRSALEVPLASDRNEAIPLHSNRAKLRRKVVAMVDRTQDLESGLEARVDDAKELALELAATTREQISRGSQLLRDYIVKEPTRALAIALGMGVILGWLIKRR